MTAKPTPRLGRAGPRGAAADLRAEILTAARTLFAERGYRETTMRAVAQAAGVDVALVSYYFGNKEGLFAETVDLPVRPWEMITRAFAEGPDRAGPRLVEMFLDVFEDPATGPAMVSLIRSATSHESAREALSEFLASAVLRRYDDLLEGPDTRRRVVLAGSQLIGMALMRFVVRLEPMVALPREQLVADVGATVQRYLTGPLDGLDVAPQSK